MKTDGTGRKENKCNILFLVQKRNKEKVGGQSDIFPVKKQMRETRLVQEEIFPERKATWEKEVIKETSFSQNGKEAGKKDWYKKKFFLKEKRHGKRKS